jgi:predicted kinase
MLIVISGLVGSGKSTLAREVSKRLCIPFHSIDDDKIETGKKYPQFKYWCENGIPFPDEFRKKVYEATLERLRGLAREHRHVIVEEAFHRKALREPFFEKATEILGGIILTLVEVEKEIVKERLEKRAKEENHIVGYEMYLSFKSKFEPFAKIDYTFTNNDNFEENLGEYLKFLREKLELLSDPRR